MKFDPENVKNWTLSNHPRHMVEVNGGEGAPYVSYVERCDYNRLLSLYRQFNADANRVKSKPIVKLYRPEIGVVGRVFHYYKEKVGKSSTYSLTDYRQKKGVARLRELMRKTGGNMTSAEELMKICVDALAASKWHMGENPSKKAYNDFEDQLFGSESRMEKWLEEAQRS